MGKAKDLKKRVSSYFTKPVLDAKTSQLVEKIDFVEYIVTTSELEAFLLEANLIKKYKPFYNIKMSDDKSYPLIAIIEQDIPYITIVRKEGMPKTTYYGRYSDAGAVKIVLKILRRLFPYQSVRNHPNRTCLYYHLHLCPCIPAHPENLSYYKKNIRQIKKFLEGKSSVVIKQLEKERDLKAKEENFEDAQDLQKKISYIQYITSPHYDPFHFEKDPDLYQKKTQEELLSLKENLKAFYPNTESLNRIECYDISNIQGKFATGSLVVLTNGEIDKSQYRRFKIRIKSTPDDFSMMQEMLTRRFKNDGWAKPDLVIVDGGKGQVSSAYEVFKELSIGIPLVGLAKREEILVIPVPTNEKLSFVELKLPISTPAINLVRRIRDEAHRFAITYHRLLRKKAFLTK